MTELYMPYLHQFEGHALYITIRPLYTLALIMLQLVFQTNAD